MKTDIITSQKLHQTSKKMEVVMKRSKTARIALIGCGSRGEGYPYTLKRLGFNYQLVALADPDEDATQKVLSLYGNPESRIFKTGEELLKECSKNLDAVIIASPNHVHLVPAVTAIRKGIKLLIEKPVATTLNDLRDLWNAWNEFRTPNVIAFVLRYTNFYQTIFSLIKSGKIGQILSLEAAEIMSDRLSMLFTRGKWRPNSGESGGLLLEKCCHDIDIINWLADSRARRISSFANRTFLLPRSGTGSNCRQCALEPECRFSQNKILQSFKADTPAEHFDLYAAKSSDDRCAYIEHPYPDHQTVNIEYENGILCNFTVVQAQPRNQRTIHIFGSEARLWGALEENRIVVYHREGPNDERPEEIIVDTDGSGHGGGDSILNNDFINMLKGTDNATRPGLKEGIDSAIMCLAADRSWKTGNIIDMNPLFNEVFGSDSA